MKTFTSRSTPTAESPRSLIISVSIVGSPGRCPPLASSDCNDDHSSQVGNAVTFRLSVRHASRFVHGQSIRHDPPPTGVEYEYWTVSYAVSRRMPRLADLLSVYQEHAQVPWWVATYMAGALLLRVNPRGKRSLVFLSVSLMALPFAWTCIFQFAGEDSSDRAELLLAMWPFLLIVTFIFALFRVRERRGIAMALPFIVIGTIHGGFLS